MSSAAICDRQFQGRIKIKKNTCPINYSQWSYLDVLYSHVLLYPSYALNKKASFFQILHFYSNKKEKLNIFLHKSVDNVICSGNKF